MKDFKTDFCEFCGKHDLVAYSLAWEGWMCGECAAYGDRQIKKPAAGSLEDKLIHKAREDVGMGDSLKTADLDGAGYICYRERSHRHGDKSTVHGDTTEG